MALLLFMNIGRTIFSIFPVNLELLRNTLFCSLVLLLCYSIFKSYCAFVFLPLSSSVEGVSSQQFFCLIEWLDFMTLDCSKPVKWVIARTSLIQQRWSSLTLSFGGSFSLGIFELQHADPSCLSFALYTKCTFLSFYFWNVICPWIFGCY